MDIIQSVNLYFGKKDPDLCRWVHSVPRGLFSYLVREAIKAHLNGDTNYHLPEFETKKNKITAITKPLSVSNDTPEDKQVYDFVTSFDDHMRSFAIKQILRKYLKPSTNGAVKKPVQIVSAEASKPKEVIVEETPKEIPQKKQNDRISKFIQSSRNRSRA